MRIKLLLLISLILIPAVIAADWKEVTVKYNWDRKSTGFCQDTNQCIVSNAYSDAFDNMPDRYWSETSNNQKPKCITDGQYISDNYCEKGQWTSRTKLAAQQLLALALNKSQNNFALYCDEYDEVLNKYQYNTDYGTVTSYLRGLCMQTGNKRSDICVNNICVLKYETGTGFAMAFNTDISGEKSPLHALNMEADECDSAKNNDGDYDTCGNNLWYNHDTQTILYVPGISPLPPQTPETNDFFMLPFNKLKNYVTTVVHKPDITQYNYTFFNPTPQFKQIYMTKDNLDFTYAFKQENITLQQISYAGWYYSNINLPTETCERIIKKYDSFANCEQQPNPAEFYIAAHKTPPQNKLDVKTSIVDVWQETTGKIRVII